MLFALVLGGEALLPLLEELVMLALEWAHKTLDLLFEEVIGLEEEMSKKASAYTGLLLLIALIVWGSHKIHQKFQQMKASFPLWWAESKAEMNSWWRNLAWSQKVLFALVLLALVASLSMFI